MKSNRLIRLMMFLTLVALTPGASAGPFPEGFYILPSSVSPDGRFGVLVPDEAHYKEDVPQNQLVATATGRVIAVIQAVTGMESMNHGGAVASWSNDGSLLH